MAVTLDISGKSMILKNLKGPDWEELRDSIKKLPGKRPIYKLNDEGQSEFQHWDVPLTELGNLIEEVGRHRVLPISEKAKTLLRVYEVNTLGIDELPPFDGEIKWKRPPKYPEQESYIRINLAKNKMIAAMDPGLGKSNCALMRALVLGGKKVLVVGPSKSNYVTWRGEVEKTTDWTVMRYHGTPQKRKKLRAEVGNYDVVYTTYTVLAELAEFEFDQIIYDEAHTICHAKTKTAKAALKIVKANPEAGLQLLSGTPISHKPKDFWFLVYLIDPLVAGDEWAWGKKYEKVIKTMMKRIPLRSGGGYQTDDKGKVLTKLIEIPIETAPQNLDHLANRVKPFTFRLKRDKFVTFEESMDFQFVEMTKRQEEMFRQAREELYLELSTGELKLSKEKLGRITRFLQICEGCYNLDPNYSDSGKLDYLFDILDNTEEKVIVWSRFKPVTELIGARYKDAVVSNGDLTPNQNALALWNFQGCETESDQADWEKLNKGKFERPGQARILTKTIDKGNSAGLNLHACRKQFVLSLPWNGNTLEQALARIKRLNQTADTVETTLIISECYQSFEEKAARLILSNLNTTLKILDGEEDAGYIKIQQLLEVLK